MKIQARTLRRKLLSTTLSISLAAMSGIVAGISVTPAYAAIGSTTGTATTVAEISVQVTSAIAAIDPSLTGAARNAAVAAAIATIVGNAIASGTPASDVANAVIASAPASDAAGVGQGLALAANAISETCVERSAASPSTDLSAPRHRPACADATAIAVAVANNQVPGMADAFATTAPQLASISGGTPLLTGSTRTSMTQSNTLTGAAPPPPNGTTPCGLATCH